MRILSHLISLPESICPEVLFREIHIQINGKERVVKVGPTVTEYRVSAKQGSRVAVFIVDEDNLGGRSEPSDPLEWVVVMANTMDALAVRQLEKPKPPTMVSVHEEEFLEDEVCNNEIHVHCVANPCMLIHEHCGEHMHCPDDCNNSTHEHCDEDCKKFRC